MNQRRWAFSEAQLSMFPELRYFVDGQAPMEDAQPYLDAQKGWPLVAAIGVSAVLAPVLLLLLYRGLGFGLASTVVIVIVASMIASWLLLGMLFPAMRRRRIRAALRERLQASGIEPCPACAYDLRGLSGPCPECGCDASAEPRP